MRPFAARMRRAGFAVEEIRVRANAGRGGAARHLVRAPRVMRSLASLIPPALLGYLGAVSVSQSQNERTALSCTLASGTKVQ